MAKKADHPKPEATPEERIQNVLDALHENDCRISIVAVLNTQALVIDVTKSLQSAGIQFQVSIVENILIPDPPDAVAPANQKSSEATSE